MTRRHARSLASISIALAAAVFGGFGLMLLFRPDVLELVGVAITRPAGAVELRGFYGGLHIGIAAFFLAAILRPTWYPPALVVQAATLGGAACGRIVGLAMGGGWEPLIAGLLAAEVAGFALATAALVVIRRTAAQAFTPTEPEA